MEKPKYTINANCNIFTQLLLKNLYRYVCKEEFFETVLNNVIFLKNPYIWKEKFPDELYLADWIADTRNIPNWLNIVYEENKKLIEELTSNKPTMETSKRWLIISIIRYLDVLPLLYNNHYSICFSQNNYETDMWNKYASDSYYLCYEISPAYFENYIQTKENPSIQQIFYSPYLDLWSMNYCEPDKFINQAFTDIENIDNLNKSFYLKHEKLYTEDEVRLTYYLSMPKEINDFYFRKRDSLERILLNQNSYTDMYAILGKFLSSYAHCYKTCKTRLRNKINDCYFEESIYLKLPTKINQYILSVKTAPDAPSCYIDSIKDFCQKFEINLLAN